MEAAQDPVLVEALDGVDRLLDLLADRLRLIEIAPLGVKSGAEQAHQQHRDLGVGNQRALHVGVRERDRRLAQVAGDRADHRDLASGQPGGKDEAV